MAGFLTMEKATQYELRLGERLSRLGAQNPFWEIGRGHVFNPITATHRIAAFFFNDTATTEIYTLSLHDALPIFPRGEDLVLTVSACTSGELPCRRYFTS